MSPESVNRSREGGRYLLTAASVVIVIAGLRAAAPLILPVLLAGFLAILSLPLLRWLRNPETKTSGYVLLAGNASAHAQALECELRSTARSELLHVADPTAWHHLSCADGCPSLADDVARLMRERTGRWSVVLVQAAIGLGFGLGLGLVGLG